MNDLINKLESARKLRDYINKQLTLLPEGSLRCHKRGDRVLFSQRQFDPKKGRIVEHYLGKSKDALINQLAQRFYMKKALAAVNNQINTLSQLRFLAPLDISPAALLRPEIAVKVSPVYIDNEGNIGLWQNYNPKRNPYKREKCIFETKCGDLLRSKSEARIADYLYDHGFVFLCDRALWLPKSRKYVYPDFIILRSSDGCLIIVEHCGMMSDPGYFNDFITKKRMYHQNGYNEGINLIFTFEDEQTPFQISDLVMSLKPLFPEMEL